MINDWAPVSSSSWNAEFNHHEGYALGKSLLINGNGFINPTNNPNPDNQTPLAKFSVKPGKNYRFRLIDIGVYYCPKRFSIDGHNLTIISIDGNPIEPVEVESIVTNPGKYKILSISW